ncbi:hypothetical protein BDC45DRAFT_542674 [Circinella umbellata]|nr:hypothetical protein BDC45DRAFT_542674 [Circinella umbellata]
MVTTNDSQQRDEVTGSVGGAMSICSSLQSREIVRQFSVPDTSATGSRPAALTREVSMHSVGTDNASANSRRSTTTTTVLLLKGCNIIVEGYIVCVGIGQYELTDMILIVCF